MNFYYISKKLFLCNFLLLNFLSSPLFIIKSRFIFLYKSFFSQMKNYLMVYNKHSFIMFISLFFNLFLMNFFSLEINIFPFSVLSGLVIFWGFMFWSLFLFENLMKNWEGVVSHLIPSNCPMVLIFFMTFIESISILIRPLTLSVRLMANITSGHLLLFLMKEVLALSFLMLLLEMMVSFIQALVFSLLLTLYYNESNY